MDKQKQENSSLGGGTETTQSMSSLDSFSHTCNRQAKPSHPLRHGSSFVVPAGIGKQESKAMAQLFCIKEHVSGEEDDFDDHSVHESKKSDPLEDGSNYSDKEMQGSHKLSDHPPAPMLQDQKKHKWMKISIRGLVRRRRNYKNMKKTERELSVKIRHSYCAPTFATLPVVTLLAVYVTDFYESVGARLGYISFYIALARSLDVTSDPMMSFLTDSFKSKYGRRKPFCVTGCWFYSLFLIALLCPPDQSSESMSNYFGAFYILFFLSNTFTTIPYDALGPELTDNYQDRSRLFFVSGLYDGFGALVAITLPQFVAYAADLHWGCDNTSCYHEDGKGSDCLPNINTGEYQPYDLGFGASSNIGSWNFTSNLCSTSDDLWSGLENYCTCLDNCSAMCTVESQRVAFRAVGIFFGIWFCSTMMNMCYIVQERAQMRKNNAGKVHAEEAEGAATKEASGVNLNLPKAQRRRSKVHAEESEGFNPIHNGGFSVERADSRQLGFHPSEDSAEDLAPPVTGKDQDRHGFKQFSSQTQTVRPPNSNANVASQDHKKTMLPKQNLLNMPPSGKKQQLPELKGGFKGKRHKVHPTSKISQQAPNQQAITNEEETRINEEYISKYSQLVAYLPPEAPKQEKKRQRCIDNPVATESFNEDQSCQSDKGFESKLDSVAEKGGQDQLPQASADEKDEEHLSEPPLEAARALVPSLLNTFQNQPFVMLLPAWVCDSVGFAIIASMTAYFVRYVIKPEYQSFCMEGSSSWECDSSYVLGASVTMLLICAFLGTPFWLWCAKKYGKTKSWLLWSFTMSITNILFLFVGEGDVVPCMVLGGINGFPFGAKFLADAILSDIIDYDEFLSGQRNEATYTMFKSFLPKICAIPAAAIPLAVLEALGHVAPVNGQVQEQPEIIAIYCKFVSVIVPTALSILSFILKYRFPLKTKAQVDKIAIAIGRHLEKQPGEDPLSGMPLSILEIKPEERNHISLLDFFPGTDWLEKLLDVHPENPEKVTSVSGKQQPTLDRVMKDFTDRARKYLVGSVSLLVGAFVVVCVTFEWLNDPALSVFPVVFVIIFGTSVTFTGFTFMRMQAAKKLKEIIGNKEMPYDFIDKVLKQRKTLKEIGQKATAQNENLVEDIKAFCNKIKK